MADSYYYMWEFVTSMTILILVAAYIIHDRIRLRYAALDEKERLSKENRLNSITMLVLGACAAVGGACWAYYANTHEIYITASLRGFHTILPGILMGIVGLILLAVGAKKYLSAGNS
jgi:hypothetical protein